MKRMLLVYKDTRIPVTFVSAVQTGGTDGTANTTGLTLTFSVDPDTLTADNITVTGATKGVLTGSGTTRSLTISSITVDNGDTVSVAIASPSGFTISGSPKTAVVYKKYNLRDTGPAGGLIFYDKESYSDGWRFLEAAPPSTEWTSRDWGSSGFLVGGTSESIGDGKDNTDLIVSADTGTAAQLCDDLWYGGYDDWFLPTIGDLSRMYANLISHSVGGFADQYYWSSSELDSTRAWSQHLGDGGQTTINKDSNYSVRAVRAF